MLCVTAKFGGVMSENGMDAMGVLKHEEHAAMSRKASGRL